MHKASPSSIGVFWPLPVSKEEGETTGILAAESIVIYLVPHSIITPGLPSSNLLPAKARVGIIANAFGGFGIIVVEIAAAAGLA
ncbi:hypothetical protein BRADI_1g37943v3 [Brachypodium distachyon]|uniref:Uncharacterized protein n=1 Tax=Brachypodium distachyon TaxID=15368 RepID=A0A2K2DND4_BRADI|nr:hypothetical protein BRADI_1g37943v3 [Brachypodium distachyon]PNT75782.1 hypothetical protein BRADI_1g37943v3 [Brachypodium distachyon]PNT75783.1 hypothetical protein BRADI_1g37943v3 [Brachypodium distachyon]